MYFNYNRSIPKTAVVESRKLFFVSAIRETSGSSVRYIIRMISHRVLYCCNESVSSADGGDRTGARRRCGGGESATELVRVCCIVSIRGLCVLRRVLNVYASWRLRPICVERKSWSSCGVPWVVAVYYGRAVSWRPMTGHGGLTVKARRLTGRRRRRRGLTRCTVLRFHRKPNVFTGRIDASGHPVNIIIIFRLVARTRVNTRIVIERRELRKIRCSVDTSRSDLKVDIAFINRKVPLN